MADLKTKKNEQSVVEFLNGIEDDKKREACFIISKLMEAATGSEPSMWGDSIVGYGSYNYKYASGREGTWFLTGFSPRKRNITLYIMSGFDNYDKILDDLGKYSTGKSCLYINKIEDVDLDVLRNLIEESVRHMVESNS